MIKATDLRIGNLVHYKFFNPEPNNERYCFAEVEVIGFLKNQFYFNFKGRKEVNKVTNLHPIPLTEEWLVKFGADVYKFDNGQPNQYRINDRLYVIRDGVITDYGTSVKLPYVHTLQNLYFALTGEELTIKEQ